MAPEFAPAIAHIPSINESPGPMFTSLTATRFFFVLLTALVSSNLFAQEFKAGVGRADITPAGPIRLAGYASRNKPSEGVYQHLFSKALALQDSTGAVTSSSPPTPLAPRDLSMTSSRARLKRN